ncbi:hypothetical protein ACS0TY_031340 [Phlomoides rotata]
MFLATAAPTSWEYDFLYTLLKEFSTMAGGFELVDLFPSFKFLHLFSLNRYRLHKIQREMNTALDLALEEHKLFSKTTGHYQFEGEDFVDVLFRMQKNKQLQFPITTDNIKAVILDIFAGGIETTATTTVWAMTELMRDPRVMAKAQSEISPSIFVYFVDCAYGNMIFSASFLSGLLHN